jgi:membrane protein insertase Oxa1/YidC/SpoIIIJ
MQRLFAREHVSMFPMSMLVGHLAQVPLLIALYSAVRQVAARGGAFLWVRDLARPEWRVAIVATALALGGAALGP